MSQRAAPPFLRLAAGIAALEGVALVGLAIAQLISLAGSRVTMSITTSAFFALYGVLLGFCARALLQLETWCRGPILLTQLLLLGLAWNFARTPLLAGVLALIGLAGLLGMLHPTSIRALGDDTPEEPDARL